MTLAEVQNEFAKSADIDAAAARIIQICRAKEGNERFLLVYQVLKLVESHAFDAGYANAKAVVKNAVFDRLNEI